METPHALVRWCLQSSNWRFIACARRCLARWVITLPGSNQADRPAWAAQTLRSESLPRPDIATGTERV
jgi:hypothetical protein